MTYDIDKLTTRASRALLFSTEYVRNRAVKNKIFEGRMVKITSHIATVSPYYSRKHHKLNMQIPLDPGNPELR